MPNEDLSKLHFQKKISTTAMSVVNRPRNVEPLSASNIHPLGDLRLACPALFGVAEGRPSAGDECLPALALRAFFEARLDSFPVFDDLTVMG